ncbi:MAG: bifunctional 5,10-methylenetetrahydrofolate dehydrogenase/5,10-methenyltetrahydrofolate cyclohydrolase [bacterium]
MIFDGKGFAKEIEERVKTRVGGMKVKPKIVSILVGNDPADSTSSLQASELYTRLKKSAAEHCGMDFEIIRQKGEVTSDKLREEIAEIGARKDVSGVMVQLPLPEVLRGRTPRVLEAIPLSKDVDGLRWEESKVMPATVRAVLAILDKISLEFRIWNLESSFVVVGARGVVGRPLVYYLRERGVHVSEVGRGDEAARTVLAGDVVISCVGEAGIVTEEMVKKGAIVVDVGAPRGDMSSEVYQKASVAVAVPGGVGPVTIACLMNNAAELTLRV